LQIKKGKGGGGFALDEGALKERGKNQETKTRGVANGVGGLKVQQYGGGKKNLPDQEGIPALFGKKRSPGFQRGNL